MFVIELFVECDIVVGWLCKLFDFVFLLLMGFYFVYLVECCDDDVIVVMCVWMI